MDEWGAVMWIESNDNGQTLDVVKASLKLKSTVSIERIIQERVKCVKEFKELGFLNQRRHVTNLANEMQLRLFFLGTPFDRFKEKKNWPEIRLVRDIYLCCKKMLKVFMEDKLGLQYVVLQPQSFGLIHLLESLLEETSYAAFQIHRHCETMSNQNLCLLYRITLYVLPKLKIIGQPSLDNERTLKEIIEMQHR